MITQERPDSEVLVLLVRQKEQRVHEQAVILTRVLLRGHILRDD